MRMPRCCLMLLCAILLAVPALAKEKITKLTFDFSEHTRVMYVVVPGKQEAMPVVVLLHGSGRNGEIMAQSWKDLAVREGFIVAAPDAFDPASWGSLMDPPEFFHAVVERVKEIHPVDESRIYLFGHSAGAAYALFLAVVDSNLFAATAIHAGALQTDPDGLFEQADRKMPIAIWVGDRDANFPVDVVEATRRLYAANGYVITLNLIPNHDHNYYVISDQVNAKAWDFLKKVRLEPLSKAGEP
jgi:poly(3-hydroxybutyrate) depolymerase